MESPHHREPYPWDGYTCHIGAMSAPPTKKPELVACPICGKLAKVKELGRTGKRDNLCAWYRVVILRMWKDALWALAFESEKSYRDEDRLTDRPQVSLLRVYRFIPGLAEKSSRLFDGYPWTGYVSMDTPPTKLPLPVAEPYGWCSAEGMGYKAIAAKLNREGTPSPSGGSWNANTLHYILHKNRDAYLGRQIYGRMKSHNSERRRDTDKSKWVIRENAWQPIITEETAAKAEQKAVKRQTARRIRADGEPNFLLTGKIFCGECSSAMIGSNAKGHLYYRCNKRCATGGTDCSMPYFPAGELEQTVVETIKRELCDKTRLKVFYDEYKNAPRENNSDKAKEAAKIEKAIEKRRREKKRVLDLLVKGTIEEDDAKPLLQQVARDIQVLEGQLSDLRSTISSSFEFRSFDEFSQIVSETMPLANSAKGLIDAFVLRVDVFNDHLHITLVIEQSRDIKKDAPASDTSVCWVKDGVKEGN